ncbi:unnamed protein product [Adineta steineri]|uniref:Arb2 domain-containing protein n=1 Tax=Adineta steineri TaxID=433720 RepID=A0A816F5Q2_9BILA|nr:unnamed protein product [Adineta steineri]CAF1658903.1 unnamed protein product [Adineta steineri]
MNTSSEKTDQCEICCEESKKLYQCCQSKKCSLCESCWSQIILSAIEKGQIGSLFSGTLMCPSCHQPIERNQLPQDIQPQLDNILLTIPKTKHPKFIEEFNYAYKDSQHLRHCITNEKFIFLSQRHYNLLGSCIDTYIQSLMKNNEWNYRELWLPIKEDNTDDHHDQVNIFTSNDFETNENGCLILIQGSGVVRPGQWARSCCINESLDIGTMFPYMAKAKEHNLSVIILNPNQTSYIVEKSVDIDDTLPTNTEMNVTNEQKSHEVKDNKEADVRDQQISTTNENIDNQTENHPDGMLIDYYLSPRPLPCSKKEKIPNLSTSREHVLYVYDNIISKSPAKNFYIVAHSAGGDGLMYLLRKRQDKILSTLSKIAFTDSVHSILPFEPNEIKNFLKTNAIHFVASDKPMGESIDRAYDFSQGSICEEVSAGHPKHEYTSGHCVEGVFKFFFPSDNNICTTKF